MVKRILQVVITLGGIVVGLWYGYENKRDKLITVNVSKTNEKADRLNKKYTREHIRELVKIKVVDFVPRSLGGAKDIKIELANNSSFNIDAVVALIKCLKQNDHVVHEEEVIFQNVKPGDVLLLPVPDQRRGVKLKCDIAHVESKELGM